MVLDTNILIAFLNQERGVNGAILSWKMSGIPLFISSITVGELLSSPNLSSADIDVILRLIGTFSSIAFDNQHATVAGEIRRKYNLELPDAGIIATAIQRGVRVVTRDKQMQKVKEVDFVQI